MEDSRAGGAPGCFCSILFAELCLDSALGTPADCPQCRVLWGCDPPATAPVPLSQCQAPGVACVSSAGAEWRQSGGPGTVDSACFAPAGGRYVWLLMTFAMTVMNSGLEHDLVHTASLLLLLLVLFGGAVATVYGGLVDQHAKQLKGCSAGLDYDEVCERATPEGWISTMRPRSPPGRVLRREGGRSGDRER